MCFPNRHCYNIAGHILNIIIIGPLVPDGTSHFSFKIIGLMVEEKIDIKLFTKYCCGGHLDDI